MQDNKRRATILVLEEDQELRDAIVSMLESDGYIVIPARGEEEALLRARQETIHLILASISRSETETMAATLATRDRLESAQKAPIVIFSATTLREGEELGLADEMYLIRPGNFNHLREFLRRRTSSRGGID